MYMQTYISPEMHASQHRDPEGFLTATNKAYSAVRLNQSGEDGGEDETENDYVIPQNLSLPQPTTTVTTTAAGNSLP